MVDGWQLGFTANATISVAYLAVAVMLALNLSRTKQWNANPLAVATVFLYVTCGGGHGVYALQLSDVALGIASPAGEGSRLLYAEWHMWAWDILTAGVGVSYWMMRHKFPDLVTGTAVFEDLRGRQRRALEIHDNVVQGLVRAKLSLELGREAEGREAVGATLAASERIVADLEEERPKPGGT